MLTNASRPEKDTDCIDDDRDDLRPRARDIHHDAMFLGVDGAGAFHFWSRYHQSVVVFQGDEHARVSLPVVDDGQRLDSLRDWIDYTTRERGDWTTLHVSGGIIGDMREVLR